MIQAIEPYLKDGECVWIDTFCHNQHDIGSVVPQMERVIADIDRLVLPMSEPPWYQRSWCIWEVLCALRANKDIVLVEYAKKARDMYQIRDFYLGGFEFDCEVGDLGCRRQGAHSPERFDDVRLNRRRRRISPDHDEQGHRLSYGQPVSP